MTKEQEEAIEWTKNVIKTIEESQMIFLEDITVKLGTTAHNNLQEILNLIQKQQAKIERLNNLNNHQSKDNKRVVDYTFELNAEIEKKDKIIDEMAEKLAKAYHYKFKKCSLKEKEQNNIDCDKYKDCTSCVKQYFEKKVKDFE